MTSSEETELPEGGETAHAARVGAVVRGAREGAGLRIGIACGRFNGGISHRLLDGALAALHELGVEQDHVTVAWVPGAFELPLAAQAMATSGRDAVICLGAVIRGDTPHFDFVAGECARGLTRVQLDTSVPVIFGVLTVNTVDQALLRSAPGPTNKGYEAALTAVEMARLLEAPELR